MTTDTNRDIQAATRAIDEMANATDLSDLKTAWESFLFRIERSWERTERFVQQLPGGAAQSWLRANAKLRRADPLLQYLKQARNAETHTIASTIESDQIISISDKFGRPFSVKDFKIFINGNTLVLDLNSLDIGIDWVGNVEPATPKLQRIFVRGKKYDPPVSHLGNRVESSHPVFVATLGLNFYKGAYAAIGSVTT